ncbi:MAG: extracellular solute-binding protein, partial [Thermomicrobiales bacterium]
MAAAAAQTAPTRPIAGTSLRILIGNHPVVDAENWLRNFATQWGQQNQVAVSVDSTDSATIPHALKTELELGAGHDLIEHIAPLPMYARELADLSDLLAEASTRHGAPLGFCQVDGLDPVSGRPYGFVHGYAPLAIFYRQSMWETIHLASGPLSWPDLDAGSQAIWQTQGIPLAIGFSNDLDSTNTILSALWANGASVI